MSAEEPESKRPRKDTDAAPAPVTAPAKPVTRVVCVRAAELRKQGYKSLNEWLNDPQNVYIGRRVMHVPASYNSKWGNPFRIVKDAGRAVVIERYREYLHLQPELIAALPELRGKTLGCWCKPELCHGDVLVEELARIDSGSTAAPTPTTTASSSTEQT